MSSSIIALLHPTDSSSWAKRLVSIHDGHVVFQPLQCVKCGFRENPRIGLSRPILLYLNVFIYAFIYLILHRLFPARLRSSAQLHMPTCSSGVGICDSCDEVCNVERNYFHPLQPPFTHTIWHNLSNAYPAVTPANGELKFHNYQFDHFVPGTPTEPETNLFFLLAELLCLLWV